MLEVVAAVLCLQDGVVRTKVRSLRDSVAMLRKNKPLFEFIIRMFLPRHEGMVSTEMDTERNIGAIIMPFFDISSNPSFFCHSNQPINVPPVMGFGSTVPRADLLTSVGLDQHTSIRVGIFIGEAKRPELKESTYLKIQSTPASSSLSVPEIQPSARPNFAQALNQTFLASLPILSLIALAATNGNKFSPNKPPPLPKHGFVFGLRYSAELILVDMMFPSWEVKTADAPDAPDAPSSGWVYNTVELGKFLLPEMFGGGRLSPGAFRFMNFMARVLEHNNELFEELSAASFHGIVGEAFRVWRHPVIDERQWLENLLQLDPAYDEILRHEEVTTIQEEYRRRREEKEEKQEKKKREKNKGKEKGKGEGNIHALEGRMGELALGD
ncbi:uncharacterized protein EI90DRAFT_3149492 [Cantharellus anzutake]|uniref:uncharacterized protein n=1 Tax=Cantharellus anzutake TaxID=1750568 RepID=UPI0019031D99|nr:uncharacterized protein EI90DRAFT_3149492 [Cantharellus anzutake]KAF8344039.1 hypothetical protein EI90DRAFT_3149492 [Cantharellus anzutake]